MKSLAIVIVLGLSVFSADAFRRPDGRVVADSSRNRLSTRSMWRATGADSFLISFSRIPPSHRSK
jgi:hypothetical protein